MNSKQNVKDLEIISQLKALSSPSKYNLCTFVASKNKIPFIAAKKKKLCTTPNLNTSPFKSYLIVKCIESNIHHITCYHCLSLVI
jgi:hypothetical protein